MIFILAAWTRRDEMGEFGGVATADRYGAYTRFDAGGRHQTCWAHRLRGTGHPARKYGCTVPPEAKRVRRKLHEYHKSVFHTARLLAAQGALAAPAVRDGPRDAGYDG